MRSKGILVLACVVFLCASAQLRFEGFNILNHTNFDSIDTGVASPTFGQVLSTREPRIIQIGLKFNF